MDGQCAPCCRPPHYLMFPADQFNESSSAPAKQRKTSRSIRATPPWMTTAFSSLGLDSMSHPVDMEAAAPATTPTPATMALLSKEDYLAQLRTEPPIDRCPVCYESSKQSYTTSCNHTFCLKCMIECAQSSHVCPMCRHVLYEAPAVEDEEDESDIQFIDLDLEDEEEEETEILEFSDIDIPNVDPDLFHKHFDWLQAKTPQQLGGVPRPDIQLETLVHIQLLELIDPALAKIVFHRNKQSTLLPSEHEDFFCRPQWNAVAEAIYKVLKSLDGRVVTSQKLLSSLTEEIENRLWAGDDDTWPQYIGPLESQRSFQEDVLTVVADLTEHAQIVWAARKEDLKRTSLVAWALRLFGDDAFLDKCLNLEERFLAWCGVRFEGHIRIVIETEDKGNLQEDAGIGIMAASEILAENVHFTFGVDTPTPAAPARTPDYEEDYDGDAD